MQQMEALSRYLTVAEESIRQAPPRPSRPGLAPFITISREAGAGGHSLATAILDAFAAEDDPLFEGWQLFDTELCDKLAENPDLTVDLHELLTEHYRWSGEDFIAQLLGRSPQALVQKQMASVIRNVSLVGKAIVVGRGGVSITRDLVGGLHLRLIASLETRVQRMMSLLGEDEAHARRYIADQDHSRKALLKKHFDARIDDPLLYDATCNSDRLPLDVIASQLVRWVRYRQGQLKGD